MFDDNWPFNKKFKRGLFFDMFDEFERMDKMINEMFEKSMKDFEKIKPGKNYVYGFSMKIGPDGKPVIEEFGNIKPDKQEVKVSDEREPITDIIDHGDNVSIISELPGVEENEIHVEYKNNKVVLDIPEKFHKEIEVPNGDPKTLKWRFKNGVLEIDVEKK